MPRLRNAAKSSNWISGGEMKRVTKGLSLSILFVSVALSAYGQCTNGTSTCTQSVPHLIRLSGTLKGLLDTLPSGVISIKFVIYGESTGGTPLWQEVQNAQLDPQ